jgi:Uma2 family endonuclease
MATTKLYTIDEVEQLDEDELCLLIEGELQELSPVGGEHAEIGYRLQMSLGAYVWQHRLGILFTPDAGFIFSRSPDTLLSPDAAFVRDDRLPPPPRTSFLEVVPDLVVEINSPFDRRADIERKIGVYLRAGVPLVWEIEPKTRSVTVYRPGHESEIVTDTGELDGGEVVPGFRLAVSRLFELSGAPAPHSAR